MDFLASAHQQHEAAVPGREALPARDQVLVPAAQAAGAEVGAAEGPRAVRRGLGGRWGRRAPPEELGGWRRCLVALVFGWTGAGNPAHGGQEGQVRRGVGAAQQCAHCVARARSVISNSAFNMCSLLLIPERGVGGI